VCEAEDGNLRENREVIISRGRRGEMSTMTELQRQKQDCLSSIERERASIRRYEGAYESLVTFKRSVEASQSEFVFVNKEKEQVLERTEVFVTNCRTAERYSAGMKNTLAGIGMKAVGATYEGLLFSIGVKLRTYLRSIESCEGRIDALERHIVSLDGQITAIRQAEQAAMVEQEET